MAALPGGSRSGPLSGLTGRLSLTGACDPPSSGYQAAAFSSDGRHGRHGGRAAAGPRRSLT